MRSVLLLSAGMAVAAQVSVHAADFERFGPFVNAEPDKTTLIALSCARKSGQLDCQFAATQIGKGGRSGECYIALNSYPVSFKASGDGRWLGTNADPQCSSGRTDYKLELDDKDKSSLARLVISGCSASPPSTLNFDAKGINWAPNCASLRTINHPGTINRIRAVR
jgi:hypothetical protein